MRQFWQGFYKQAAKDESPIEGWLADAKAQNDKLQNKEEKKNDFDPREAGEWIGPEVWYHNWPSAGHV